MQHNRSFARIAGLSVLALIVLVVGFQLLTGSTRIVVASGSSMEPTIEAGDLILIRDDDEYGVGEIVAYESAELGTVLHRIVEVDEVGGETTFVLQGDNNDFVDSATPSDAEVLGQAAAIVPNGGVVLGLLPVVAAGLFAAWFVLGGDDAKNSASGRRGRRSFTPREIGGWVVVGLSTVVVVVAVLTPGSQNRQTSVKYENVVSLDWGADAPPSVVYPTGEIDNADPVFLSEIDRVELVATIEPDEKLTDVEASVSMRAMISDRSGWSRDVYLPASVGDWTDADPGIDAVDVRSLDTIDLGRLLDSVLERTGVRVSGRQLTITLTGQVSGQLDGRPVVDVISLPVVLSVEDGLIGVEDGVIAATPDTEWSTTSADFIVFEEKGTASIGLGGVEVPVRTVRLVAPLLLGVGLLIALWPGAQRKPEEIVERQLGGLVVGVDELDLPDSASIVTVSTVHDLVQIAEMDQAPVLRMAGDPQQWYTSAFGTWYRFDVSAAQPAAQEEDTPPKRLTRAQKRAMARASLAEATSEVVSAGDTGASVAVDVMPHESMPADLMPADGTALDAGFPQGSPFPVDPDRDA
ncbi:MAG: signal peptidase I [Actinomycetota bacterium]